MSRIGRKPVTVPANVKISIVDQTIEVEGPKGKLELKVHPAIAAPRPRNGLSTAFRAMKRLHLKHPEIVQEAATC